MKRSLLITLVFLLALTSCGTARQQSSGVKAPKTSKNYIVGFYNLENLFDIYDDPAKNDEEFLPEGKNKWTQGKYEKKVHNMAHVIAEMAKSNNGVYHTILGVSEVENRMVLEDLVADPQIKDANFQIVHYDGPDRRGVDVALLYRPDLFEYLDSESIPFTFDSEIEFNMNKEEQDYFRTRDILMVHGRIDGEDIAIYVAHLPSRIGGKGWDLRGRGGEIMYNHAKMMEKKYPGIKVVCMGDMNDNPTDPSMAHYLRGVEDINAMTPDDFFSPYISMLKAGYGSLAYNGEWSIYDLQLVNYNLAHAPKGSLQILPTSSKGYYGLIFKREFMLQASGPYKNTPFRTFSSGTFIGGYSDHLPTYIIIGK